MRMIILCILWFILYNGVRVFYTVEHTHVTGTRAARCYRSAPSVRPIDVVAILVVQPSSSTVVTRSSSSRARRRGSCRVVQMCNPARPLRRGGLPSVNAPTKFHSGRDYYIIIRYARIM